LAQVPVLPSSAPPTPRQRLAHTPHAHDARHTPHTQVNYNNKQLVGGMIVAGWDKLQGGQVRSSAAVVACLAAAHAQCSHAVPSQPSHTNASMHRRRVPASRAQVFGCPIGGTLVEEQWTCDGSGSTYIWGYMDSAFKCAHKPRHAAVCCTHNTDITRHLPSDMRGLGATHTHTHTTQHNKRHACSTR
jgi:hypothetical protein